jgi:hypothetical protein
MTIISQTTDTAEHILAWLAAQRKGCQCFQPNCDGYSLAFEWASKPCPKRKAVLVPCPADCPIKLDPHLHNGTEHQKGCTQCNGSGRVPKAVGLEELLAIQEMRLFPPSNNLTVDGEPGPWLVVLVGPLKFITGEATTPLLAALRAVAAQAGMPLGKDA